MRRWRGSVSKRSETPVRSPQANSICERLIGTLLRECLDWIIPLSEAHLRKTLMLWMFHYNHGTTRGAGAGYPGTSVRTAGAFATPSPSARPAGIGSGSPDLERPSP